MLEKLPRKTNSTPEVDRFLLDLLATGFDGETATDESSLSIASTDNSIWQIMPQVVISPRSHTGVTQVVKLLAEKSHRHVSITPRGGGTSTAGQSLTNSIVLDCKRYMHRILHYDHETKLVQVECGAVLQQVNDELKQYGVMIGPTVATASRATIGGMIGNDSAGKGSQVYGKMSDCVVSLETVIRGGTSFENDSVLIESVKLACDNARPYFKTHWPKLPRFISGYNLPMAWDGETFDCNRIFCGSEGSLGVTTSATLQCVPIPTNQELVLLCFDSFDDALRCGASLCKHKPTAVETVDELVLKTLRKDSSWSTISPLLGGARDDTNAILFVECNNSNSNSIFENAKQFNPQFAKCIVDTEEQTLAWTFRSRSVGLLSSLKGPQRPIPFVEDFAVPPEKLAGCISAFKKILSKHDLQAGMFGHVDAGVMHIRPAINMRRKSERKKIRIITEEVVKLVHSYGGVLWGEHGKGLRSEFGPEIFGEVIWEQMCNIKNAFDPHNQFNPGKVAVPNRTFSLSTLETTTRGEYDERTPELVTLSNATRCDGNGECQSISTSDSMCPTYRATDDPSQSPRGRAEVLRRWLQRIEQTPSRKNASFIKKLFNSGNEDDFNHEVKHILDGCIACKACATECPMQIDIPAMRSQFYAFYFTRYLRPMRDTVWLNMEKMLPLQKFMPSRLIARLVGICDPPKPNSKVKKQINTFTPEQIVESKPDVVLLQDSFTSYFRPAPFFAMVEIIKQLGLQVKVLPLRQCGKAQHVRGALTSFDSLANENIKWISPIADANIPIIGIDPAATLLWRDEYPENNIDVLLPQEWLVNQDLSNITLSSKWRLFPHCIERSSAQQSNEQWKQIFASIGSELEIISTSCCGMGGLFGHQKEHKQVSLDIWDIHWGQHNPQSGNALTTGYSCYSQAKRIENISLLHPLEVIATTSPTTR